MEKIHITPSGFKIKKIYVTCYKCQISNWRAKSSIKDKNLYKCIKCSNKERKNTHRIGVSPANKQIKCLVPCKNCEKIHERSKRRLLKHKFTFCDTKCQNRWQNKNTTFNKGKNNPAYRHGRRIDGKIPDYGSDFTKQLRRSIKIRDNFDCQQCKKNFSGKKAKFLDVHHIDQNRYNNSKSNLISLCKSCHTKIHWNKLNKGNL